MHFIFPEKTNVWDICHSEDATMSLGSYLNLGNDVVGQITSFVSRARAREDQENLLDQDQLQSFRNEDTDFVVINEEDGLQPDGEPSIPHHYPLGLSPVQVKYLIDRPAAIKCIEDNLQENGFVCKFNFETKTAEILSVAGQNERQALRIIQNSIVEMDLPAEHLAIMELMGDKVDLLPTPGPDEFETLVVKVGDLVKLVGMAPTMKRLDKSLKASMASLKSVTKKKKNGGTPRDLPTVTEENKTEVIQISEHYYKYLQDYKWSEITNMCKEFQGVVFTEEENKVILKGPPSAVDAFAQKIRENLECLRTEEIPLGPQMRVVDIAKLAMDIGQKHRCLITMNQKFDTKVPTQLPSEKQLHSLSLSVSGRRYTRVRVLMNALENQKADVLVNTTNSHLELCVGQGVSSCILRAAGPSIQTEVREHYPDGIQPGEVAVSGPGNIKTCKAIFHGALPMFPKEKGCHDCKEQEDECFKWMVSLVFNCLIKASEMEYKTVAFPAIGTGFLDYPVQHVVQLMYKAIRLYNDDKRSGPIKEVTIVIFPDTKLEVKQLFLAHRQTHKLKTRHVATIDQIHEENKKRLKCEIRVHIGNNLLQVVHCKISEACNVTDAVLVLWSEQEIVNPDNNPGLTCTDPTKPDWKCSPYVSELPESLCVVDNSTLDARTLIHSYCEDNSNKSFTDAIVEGLKTAARVKCNTATIPIAFDGHMAKKPRTSAQMIMDAIKAASTDIHVITVAIQEDAVFIPFVSKVASVFDKLQEPADIDKSPIAIDLWERTFANKTAESTATLRNVMTNFDAVLTITADSEQTTKLAKQDIESHLTSMGYTDC